MGISAKGLLAGLLVVGGISGSVALPAEAAYYNGYVGRSHTSGVRSYFYRHPKVKAATIGAGVGTAAGAATGLISGRGIGRGALIGAGTGTAVGLIRSSHIMRRHPYVKNGATGTLIGMGLGLAASHGHGHPGLKGAAVGGGIGLGYQALSNMLR
jgi:hypothetical protein